MDRGTKPDSLTNTPASGSGKGMKPNRGAGRGSGGREGQGAAAVQGMAMPSLAWQGVIHSLNCFI